MSRHESSSDEPSILGAIIAIGAFVGWMMNIVKLGGSLHGDLTTMAVCRLVGVIVAPLGAILGFF